MTTLTLMLLAWMIEAAFGWPDWLYKRIGHPVVWIGAFTTFLESRLNNPCRGHTTRYMMGAVTTVLVVGTATTSAFWISALLPETYWGVFLEALMASSLLASRSLYTHVNAVKRALKEEDIEAARHAVSRIVGRDTTRMSASEASQAAIESLAENTSDGVVAPLLWGCIFGLPGLVFYKAINTLDSMIGHVSVKYEAFGGVAARLDDVANYLPARLTAVVFAITHPWKRVLKVIFRDASSHRSVNAGWPEAALAARLNVRLAGPRSYAGKVTDDPWIHEDGADATAQDLSKALDVYRQTLTATLLGLLAVVILGLFL